jgi:hypothetical protein
MSLATNGFDAAWLGLDIVASNASAAIAMRIERDG